jgi:hypothetical protein
MRHPRLTKLEDDLEKIHGVTGVRVVGDESPSEIHIVATSERAPKQIVRDVQSLTTTELGEPIDHRIVSVVQLEATDAVAVEQAQRIALEQVITASKPKDGWVRVSLRLPGADTTEGAALAGPTRDDRARAAVHATLKALQPRLETISARLGLQSLLVHNDAQTQSVQVKLELTTDTVRTILIGAAVVEDDIATASARAVLQALNRKLT